LGLTLAGSKGQKGDELPRNGLSLCEFFFIDFTKDSKYNTLHAGHINVKVKQSSPQ